MNQKRILLVDDNAAIHKDFLKVLSTKEIGKAKEAESLLFGATRTTDTDTTHHYIIDSAYQGTEALELVRQSLKKGKPYALAFVDIRMPPGWDGIETIKRLWEVDPNIQMVICSAYSDQSWESISTELGDSANLLILKKPFDMIEINQLASALTTKWELVASLQALVKKRTDSLENSYSLSKATLESIHEGILAVGLDGRIITYNNNFLNQWHVSEDFLTSNNLDVIFDKLADRVENPVFFKKMMNELRLKPMLENLKEWKLKGEGYIELFTRPQYLHNEMIGIVYSFLDITEQKSLEQQLLQKATHDVLTGLPNRALFLDRFDQAILRAKRYKLYVAVLQIDLDFFKEINDTLGHNIGDLFLHCLAARMSKFSREVDTIARSGGDEFIGILAAQADEKNFIELLTRFSKVFAEPCQIEGHNIVTTASIGVSIYPQDGEDAETLLKNADIALYEAKKSGGNRFQFYMEEFNKQILQRSELRKALSQALEKKELELYYQPLIDLKSGKILGVEALLRWEHPTMGNVSPAIFIPIAEESGIILSIGEWVLKTACEQAVIWQTFESYSALKMSVNISPKQFQEENFVSCIHSILEKTKLEPNFLDLEITEGLILKDIKKTTEKMKQLKKIGVHFAIDDFGTGYSALSYLKNFQFDTIKIDKSFIDNINSDVNNASIVNAIITMTKNMNIKVLAEGVEHIEQVNFLLNHHADQVQGYYFSKPLSVKELTEHLKKQYNAFDCICKDL